MARNYESAVLLTGDASGAVKAITLTDDHLRQLNARQQRNQDTTRQQSESWGGLSTAVKGAAAAMGLSVAGLAALGTSQIRAVAETDRLAQSIGVQTGQLQAMQYAAQRAGLEQDKMGDILKDVSDKIGDAVSNGGGEAIDVLNNLGLSAQRLAAMAPDQQLLAIAQNLDKLGTRAQQVNALETLGNDASRLLPLLENNAAALRRLMREGYDLNVAMKPGDIASFVEAQGAIETIHAAVNGLTNSVLIDLAPAITSTVEDIRGWVDEAGGMEVVVDRISNAFGVAIDVAEVLFAVWLGRKAHKALTDTEGWFQRLSTAAKSWTPGAIQQQVAYQAKLGEMAGISRTAAVSQAALAGTIRSVGTAARGTFALLGGWPGLILTAGAALYSFSSDADDAAGSVDVLTQSTDEFTESLRSMTKVKAGAALVRIADEIEETRDKLRDAAADVSRLSGELDDKGPVPLRGRDRDLAQDDLALALEREEDARNRLNLALERQNALQDIAAGKLSDTADAANTAAGGLGAVERALGSSDEKWGEYLAKLKASRDTLGMTAAEAAEYAAAQAGYTGLYAEQSGAIAGQTEALNGYKAAIEQGDQAAADSHLATAQRYAEAEAMVQAELENLDKLSGLLQGVESDLSATALSAALVVGEGAAGTADLLARANAIIEARAAAIRQTTTFGSKAREEARALAQSIKDAQQTYDSLRESFDPLGTAADAYAKKQNALNLLQREGKESADAIAQAQAELTRQYHASIDPLQGIFDRMNPAAARARDFRRELEQMQKAARAAGRSELEITAATAQLTAEFEAAERAADPLAVSVQDVVEQYNRAYYEGLRLERELAAIRDAWARDPANAEQYARAVAGISERMRELALESDPVAQEMARAWTEAADRIDETFADAFTGAFDSFEDFSGQLMDGFKRLLAELAYQAFLQPIVVGFTADMQRGLDIPGAPSGATTAGGIGQVVDQVGDLGDYAQWGKKAWNVFSGGGSAGASGGLYGNIASGSAAASGGLYGNVAASGGLYGNIATGGSAAGTGFMATAGSMVPQVAAAWAAQQALNAGLEGLGVYDWLGLDTSGTGAQWGGTLLGPVGTIGGAMLDNLFGSSREFGFRFSQRAENPEAAGIDLGYDADGRPGMPWYSSGGYADGDLGRGRDTAFGSFGFLSKEVVEPADMIDLLDGLERVDNLLAAGATDAQEAAGRQRLDGFYYKGDSFAEMFEQRYGEIRQGFLDSSSDFVDTLIERVPALTIDNAEDLAPKLANALQLGQLVEGFEGTFRDYADRIATDVGVPLDEALSTIQTSYGNFTFVTDSASQLGLQFDALGDGAVEAANRVVTLSGGVDALSQSQSAFYQLFYSEQERAERATDALRDTLGEVNLSLPSSVDGMRDLVQSLDLTTEAGAESYAALTRNSAAISEYVRRQQAVETERQGLEDELLKAQGKATELLARQRERELAGLDESNRALQERIWSLQDEAKAQEAAEAAAERAREQAALESSISLYATGTVDAVEDALAGYDAAMSAAQAAAQEQRAAMESWRDAVRTVSQLADDLLLSDRSILDPLERLDEAQRQWVEQSVRAETNPDAASNLGQSGDAYLEALAAAYGQSSAEYAQGVLDVEDTYRSLEDLYGEQLDTLGSQESIARQQLREEQRATAALRDQLSTLGNIGDLLGDLPTTLAQAIAEALPGYDPGSVGSGGGSIVSEDQFDTAAYLYNKTAQVNANAQDGRTDWTLDEVRERIMQDYGSVYQHYVQIGASEGVSPSYDGNDQSSGAAFDPDLYIARKRDQLNRTAYEGKSDWTIDEVWSAFADAGLTPWEHSQRYGAKEGIDGYHREGLDRVPYDGYRAVLHADEMVLTRDIADTVRAGMQSLDASRALPPAIVPPAFTGGGQSGAAAFSTARLEQLLEQANQRIASLEGQLSDLVGATGRVASHTGAALEPARRTAEAAESTARNGRISRRKGVGA
ncbi:hypothetical protein QO259_17060 [Salinicola sp. JS01]|uniref:hypothetical protein n=1 Tax=Salinicola sp. JS01 TaxID=3050071 RepID=UPI00255BF091|nr:hypothetical protein [Salinicola sp. JS01]WIX32498.1 hypothetical protein QO259_17060 [Salinicola sp. JS01]